MITDEMLAEAAAELNQALIDGLPDPHECKHQFSKKFERKMEKLIRRVNHPIRHMVLNRVASILLVILLGFTMVMSFSPTARAAVIGWIKQAYESFYSYYFETDVETDSNYRYQIDPVPDGYIEMSYAENNGYHVIVYSDNETAIVLAYADRSAYHMLYVKREGYRVEEAMVNGNIADLYISEDVSLANGIVWCDTESGYMVYISGQLEINELKNFAERVKKCPY